MESIAASPMYTAMCLRRCSREFSLCLLEQLSDFFSTPPRQFLQEIFVSQKTRESRFSRLSVTRFDKEMFGFEEFFTS
jgi:hypothetical protein